MTDPFPPHSLSCDHIYILICAPFFVGPGLSCVEVLIFPLATIVPSSARYLMESATVVYTKNSAGLLVAVKW